MVLSMPVPRPSTRPARALAPPLPPAGPAGSAPVGPAGRGPRRPLTRPAPRNDRDLLAMVRAFAQLYLEVEAGWRERRQLAALVPPRVARRMTASPTAAPPGTTAPVGHVHGVFGTRTAAKHFDAVAILRRERRYEALAVRLRRNAGGWSIAEASRPQDQISVGWPD